MIPLDSRSRDILLILLRSNKPLVAQEIASRLKITPRMVRYSLKRAEAWLRERGVSLESKTNFGIVVDSTTSQSIKLISELKKIVENCCLSPDERLHVVILELLTAQKPVLVKQLEHRLSVSRPTVLHDLSNAEEWLKDYDLSVTSRPHFGFQAFGFERNKQEAIVSLLIESSNQILLTSLCIGPRDPIPTRLSGESNPLREYLNNLEIPILKRMLDTALENLELQISDNAYISLILYLSLLIARIQQGQRIEFSLDYLKSLSAKEELQEAKLIGQKIQFNFQITLTDSEVAYITAQFLAVRSIREIGDNILNGSEEDVDPRVREMVESVLEEASNYLHPFLRVDQELINSLSLHLRPSLIKLLLGLPIRNPLLENIKRQYPYIFQVVRKSSSILQKKMNLDVPEEEIAYITLHLGAAMERLRYQFGIKKRILIACSEGIATAWLLVSKIHAELTEIEIVQVMSLQELRKNRVSRSDIDAIVSTIPLEVGDIPVITVNPILKFDDITRLKETLGLVKSSDFEKTENFTPYFGKSLTDLLTTDTIMLRVEAQGWQDVVEKAGELLFKAGTIELAYVDAMKRIIVEYGPYAVTWPGAVLLHARPNEGVKCLCMSLITLRTPVQFGHPENDPVDVALVLGAVDTNSHLRALKELSELMADENALTTIRQSFDPTEVRTILSHFTSDEHNKAIAKI